MDTSTGSPRLDTVVLGVFSCAIYAVLFAAFQFAYSKVGGRNPAYRQWRLVGFALLWLVGNAVIWYGIASIGFWFSLASTLGLAAVFCLELVQFWRIGLVGADAHVSSGLDYAGALKLCTSSLEFLGIGASKLTDHSAAFKAAIDRCDRAGRPIRLLLSRPDNEGLARIALMADRDRGSYQKAVQQSLRIIASHKVERQKNIQVRFYKEFPTFRLMFINDTICLASHYVLGKGDGSSVPQLHILKSAGARDIDSLSLLSKTGQTCSSVC